MAFQSMFWAGLAGVGIEQNERIEHFITYGENKIHVFVMRTQNALILGFALHVQSQLILGALAAFEIVMEIVDVAGAAVAELTATANFAVTGEALGQEGIELAAVETEINADVVYGGRSTLPQNVHGSLELDFGSLHGHRDVTGTFQLNVEPLRLDARTITPKIKARFDWRGLFKGSTRRQGGGIQRQFRIDEPTLSNPHIGTDGEMIGYTARIKKSGTQILRSLD